MVRSATPKLDPPDGTPPEPDAARGALTREDWIRAATEVLVAHGIDAVRVDVLAKTLAVSRGSFYWHFRDRSELLRAVLEAWQGAATEALIERFERQHREPATLLQELLTLPLRGRAARRAAAIELAIRAWARRDDAAREALDAVDARRLGYIAQCYSALGHGIAEARARAFLFYGYEVAESLLWRQGTTAEQDQRRQLLASLLLPAAPTGAAPAPVLETTTRRPRR